MKPSFLPQTAPKDEKVLIVTASSDAHRRFYPSPFPLPPSTLFFALTLLLAFLFLAPPAEAATATGVSVESWWVWPLALFVVCFLLGIVSVPAGVGGGASTVTPSSP